MNTAPQTGLAARLKAQTRPLHTLAERSGVMADLLHGRLPLHGYVGLLRNLHAIYATLEAGLDDQPPDGRLWRPELRRLPALEQDLDALRPRTWRTDLALAPAATAYVARLRQLAHTEPVLRKRGLTALWHGGGIVSKIG